MLVTLGAHPMSKHTPPPLDAGGPLVQGADPGSWLRDLGLAYQDAGDLFLARGYLTKASEKFQAGLNIFDRLAAHDPDNLTAQADLAGARARVADAHAVEGEAQGGSPRRAAREGWL